MQKLLPLLLLSVSLLGQTSSTASEDVRVYSVCDIVSNLSYFRNRTVLVRGWIRSGREIFVISGIDCPNAFVTQGHTWPNSISLSSTDETRPGVEMPPWSSDRRDMARLREQIKAAQQQSLAVEATVEGMIIARAPSEYVVVRRRDGWVATNGFGHLGGCPAMIFIKSVRDVELKEDPASGGGGGKD